MHILLIHQAFAALDEPGGTRHHEFASFLADRGHKVTVITSSISYLTGGPTQAGSLSEQQKGQGGVVILRAASYRALHKSFLHRVLSFITFMTSSFFTGLSVKHVDLIWGTSPPIFQGVTAWLLARLKRVPFAFEVRDLWPAFAIAVGVLRNRTLVRLSLWLERFLYRRADRVLVNSPGYIEHVIAHGALREHVELVPNGSDPAMFDPLDNGASFRFDNRMEGKFIVLYAGAHGISNDLGMALDAARLLQDNRAAAEVTLVFLGDGKEKLNLQKQAAEMGLTNVAFLPPVPKMKMAATLAGADACLAILKPIEAYQTTYPNKVFDYMAAGRPILLAIDGVIREVIEAAGCGVFVQPGDPSALAEAICSLAGDKARAHCMGLAGRRYLEEYFSRDKISEKLLDIFTSLTRPSRNKVEEKPSNQIKER
jgi:glycosyltransferase involved in cell wall biosynthesis